MGSLVKNKPHHPLVSSCCNHSAVPGFLLGGMIQKAMTSRNNLIASWLTSLDSTFITGGIHVLSSFLKQKIVKQISKFININYQDKVPIASLIYQMVI